jgi:ABC-type spermidine/putrescine transport system permease subunit II
VKIVSNTRKIFLIYTGVALAFVYFPLLVIIVLSFNDSAGIGLPFIGFSTVWYSGGAQIANGLGGFFYDQGAINALENSVMVGIAVAILTTGIAITSVLALRRRFWARDFFFYLILAGFLVPGVVYGLGALFLFHQLAIPYSLWSVIPVQMVYALPFGLILLLPRFDREMEIAEDAARVLGASPWVVFRRITLPLIFYQVVGVFMFSFVISWGELTRTSFVTTGLGTLPVYLYTRLQTLAPTPEFYAIGTIVTAVAVALVITAGLLLSRNQRRLF